MDWPIKQTLLESSNNEAFGGRTFVGINSYNIGRPLLQMVHFVSLHRTLMCDCLDAKSYRFVCICGEDLDLFENGGSIRY